MTSVPYRLALDLGTNSIGWCLLDLDARLAPTGVRAAGVRIFPDGRDAKTKASLAVDRRLARQMRRRRDRYLNRRAHLLNLLVTHGLMPADVDARKVLERLDPYRLRAKGVHERLTPFEFGRVLFHLNQRRGFRSNRKTDKGGDAGKIKPAVERLRQLMAETGARTLGEYLDGRRRSNLAVRVRLKGQGAAAAYDYYPERSLLEDEFDTLWNVQISQGLPVEEAARDALREVIFHQRPLQPVKPGRCTLEPDNERAPLALPIAQRFRIMQELNHLRIVTPELDERPLTLAQRDVLASLLLQGKDLKFEAMRGKLGLAPAYTFNLEGDNRDLLKGDVTARLLAKKDHFGSAWHKLTPHQQEEIVHHLLEEEDEAVLVARLVAEWGLDARRAGLVASLDLPSGYARFCREALHKVTACMEKEVIHYADAVGKAGYASHSHFYTGEVHDRLPYYGMVMQRHVGFGSGHPADTPEEQYGRIANPTVHIALNQLRRVVNELLKEHGHPAQVAVEVARDLKNGLEARREIAKRQAEQKRQNDRRKVELQAHGVGITADALLRMRLWEELAKDVAARCCPYTGEHISMARLFSAEVEIEHILPFARTLDNSPANMTVSLRRANRYKGNRSPEEAFSGSADGYDWQGIVSRASLMPVNKRWRFGDGAMQRYEENDGFLDRQLVDTQYIARVAREYLSCVCDARQVWVTPGRLTSLLAGRWGFPPKDRNDHRHHARDAVLIGVTDRSVLQSVAAQHARNRDAGVERFLADLPEPWPGFRVDALTAVHGIVVSHKSDHGTGGALHNQTAYGVCGPNGTPRNAQYRVPVESLASPADLLRIKGRKLRVGLLAAVSGRAVQECAAMLDELDAMPEKLARATIRERVGSDEKAFKEAVSLFAAAHGIRRVRVFDTLTLIPIRDKGGRVYKGFKGDSNAYYDIYERQDGEWVGCIVSTMDANRPGFIPEMAEEGLRHVMRLFRGDMVELEDAGVRKIYYLVRISEKQFAFAEHAQANVDSRNRDKADPFAFLYKCSPAALRKAGVRLLHVTPAGKVIRV